LQAARTLFECKVVSAVEAKWRNRFGIIMKKIIVSMGLAAVGTASLQAAYAPDMSDTSKIWSVSASLRSFYDDNYATVSANKKGSFGFQVSPQFELNAPLRQTELGLRYIYGLSYYQERENLGQSAIDQTHQFDLWVDHAFTERWKARVQDSFVVAQEPELLTPAGAGGTATPTRVSGNNIVNTAKISLTTDWTDLFSTVLGYQNTFYDYQNSGGNAANPSLAGLLNRDENLISLDFQFHVLPTTTAFFGYQYGQIIYTGNEPIAPGFTSSARDNRSHYGYVGVQHAFLENLTGTARAGVQYTQDYNDPAATTSVGPYASASLVYTYASGSYAQIGLTHSRNATVQAVVDSSGNLTQDQESTVVYGSINHQLTSKLVANAMASFQDSTYNGGLYNGQSDDFYSLGLNLTYNFTRHFSAETGYNFDDYVSGIPGNGYTRNRVYLGVTASY
jgi:hypothetical protein